MTDSSLDKERQRRLERRKARSQRPATREEVLRRNLVERIKEEKHPYKLIDELPQLVQTAYEEIPENDILRLQWYGLYHDKPKVGYFMMRIKLPGGMLTPQQLRVIGELSCEYGRNEGELTTRQDIQLHWIELPALPAIFSRLEQAGLTTKGGCGDVLRNVTSCPVAGLDAEELFDVTPLLTEIHRRFSGNPEYGNLPRKHKWTISACPYHCNAPEIHDVALVATRQDGQDGFAVWVGGGLSTVPRIARPLGVFVTADESFDVLTAILTIWSSDLRYRMTRAKARFKFMVDDHGPDAIREMIQRHLGRELTPLQENPQPIGRTSHLGVHAQKQPGLSYIGFPVFPGRLSGEQMIRVAEIAESIDGVLRITRQQNLVVANVPNDRVSEVVDRMKDEVGLDLNTNPIRAQSIACTGEPHCNFAVGATKPKLVEIIERLEQRYGEALADLHIHLDGCPHACGQHWVGDIGVQGTTTHTPSGKIPAYDILVRGGLGPGAAIAKAVVRRVPFDQVTDHVDRLVGAYLQHRQPNETIQQFFMRHSDDEIRVMAQPDVDAQRAAS